MLGAAHAQLDVGNVIHPTPLVPSLPPPPPHIDLGTTLSPSPSINVPPPPIHEGPGLEVHHPSEQCSIRLVCHPSLCAPGYSSCPDNCSNEKVCQ
jgi:hypothetical protein